MSKKKAGTKVYSKNKENLKAGGSGISEGG